MNKKNTLKKSVGLLSITVVLISFAGKIFGFIRELLMAKYFGTSSIVDVYLMSYTIPSILFGALPALGVGFTPVYFKINNRNDQNSFLTKTILLSFSISLVCIIITFLGDSEIVGICASGFSEEARNQTISFLRITVWSILFNTPVQVLIAYLNCNKEYINCSLSGLVTSITNSIFIVMAARFGEKLLPWGYLVPYIIQFVWLLTVAITNEYKPTFNRCKQSPIKQLLILVIPICISNMLTDINGFVDKSLGSYLQEGSLASLNYAFTLRAVIVTVFQTLIATIYYPTLSEFSAKGMQTSYNALVKKILFIASIIVIPLNVFFIFLPKEIILIILVRGTFDINSLNMTTGPFVMYMLSLTFIIIREVFIRIMYISNDSKGNLCYGAANVIINIILSLALVGRFGHVGLALATSIATIITFPLYIRKVKRLMPSMPFKDLTIKIIKIIISALSMGMIVLVLRQYICISVFDSLFVQVAKLFLYFIGGVVVYISMLGFLKVFRLSDVEKLWKH